MDYLLPSELARLVLGYLESRGCKKTASNLLQELPELSEVAQLRQQGRQPCARVGQQSLTDALSDYAYSREIIRCAAEDHPTTMGYLLEKHLLSDQLRCFVSSATVSRRAETAKPSRRGKGKNQRQKHTMEQSGQGLHRQDQKQQPHENNPPIDEINIDFPETSEAPNDVAMVQTVPSTYQQQNLEAAIAAPAGVCSNTINMDSGLGSTSHRSPKRKGFQVKRWSPTDKDAQMREYKEQLTHIVLNNTDFHERIANAINRTLAKSEYHDLNRSHQEAHNQLHQERPLNSECLGDSAASSFGVNHPTTAGGSNSGSINLGSILQCTSEANKLNYKTPSKRSSAVAQTVSKMLLSDPNYHDIFFFGMGGDFGSTSPPARSPSPTSRLLSTPEPSPPQYERPGFYNAAEAASDYLTPITIGNSQLIAAGLGSSGDDAQPTTILNSSKTNFANNLSNSSSPSVEVASNSPVPSASDKIKHYNACMPDTPYNSETSSVNCLQAFNVDASLHSTNFIVGQPPVPSFTQNSSLCNSFAPMTTSYPIVGDHSQQASTIDDARKDDAVSGAAHDEANAACFSTGGGVASPSITQPPVYSPRNTPAQNTRRSASSDVGDLQQPSPQLDEQSTLLTTPKPIPTIPRIISKTIPFLDNSACFRQDYDSFSKGTNRTCSGDEIARTALSHSVTALTAFANDASPLIPTSVRDALMPILNKRQGSVISIAGTSTTGLGGGLLTVVHIPKDESDGAKTLKLLKPKPIEGTALNGPMTVTLPNEIEVTFQDKIVKKIPKQVEPKTESIKRPSCKNTKLMQQTVTSEPLAGQNKHDGSPSECSSNHEDQFEQQLKENGDIDSKASDCQSTDGNSIILAAIGAAMMQDSPDKFAAAPPNPAAATVSSSPHQKAGKSSYCLSLSRNNSRNKNRRSPSSNDPQREHSESTCAQQSMKFSENIQESTSRHEVSCRSPLLKFQKRSMSEGTSSDLVRSPTFVRRTRASIRLKTKKKENKCEQSCAVPTLYPFDEMDTKINNLPTLEKNPLEEINSLKSADIACEKTMSAVKTMNHTLNDDLLPKRGSLSTPSYKRKRSYVRVLDFKTPNKSSSNVVGLKERKPRSLFNSPSPNKTKNSALSNRSKNCVSLSKKTPSTKRTLDVISEESISDNPLDKSNDSSPPTKKLKLSIAEQRSTDYLVCNDLPGTEVASEACVTSVQSCHTDLPTSDITAHAEPDFMQPVSSIETHYPRRDVVPYSMSDYFTTPMKFPADIILEAPTPCNQGIKSTNKRSGTISKNELNTPVPSQFPPPSPCPKTPRLSRDQRNSRQHSSDDARLADEIDLQLVADHNKHNIHEDGQSSSTYDGRTITEPCDSNCSPKINKHQQQESAISVASVSIYEMSPTSMGIALERELQTSIEKSSQARMDAVEEDGNIVFSQVTVESDVDGAAVKACVPVFIPKVAIALLPSANSGPSSITDAAVRSLEDIVDGLESGEINPKSTSCSETKKSKKKKKKDKKEGKRNKSKNDKSRDLSVKEQENKQKKGKKDKKCKKTKGDVKARKSRKKESLHETGGLSNVGSVLSNKYSCLNMSDHSCASNTSPENIPSGDQVPYTKLSRVSSSNETDISSENERNQGTTPSEVSPLRFGDISVSKKLLLSASKAKVVVSPLRKKYGKLALSKSLWKSPKSSKKEEAPAVSEAITMRNLFGCTSDDDWEDDNEDDLSDLSVQGTNHLKNGNNTSGRSPIRNEFKEVTNYSTDKSQEQKIAGNGSRRDNVKKILKDNGKDTQTPGAADNFPTQNDAQEESKNNSCCNLLATVTSPSFSKEVSNGHACDDRDETENLSPENVVKKITSNGNEASNTNKPNSSCSSEEDLSVSSQTKNLVKVMSSSDSAARKIVDRVETSNITVDAPVRRSTRRKIPKNITFSGDVSAKSKQTKSKKISDELIVSEIEVNVLTLSKVRRIEEKLDKIKKVDKNAIRKSRQESVSNKKCVMTASDTPVDSATQETSVAASTKTTENVAKNAFSHWGSGAKKHVIQSPRITHEMDAPAAGSQSPADVWDKWTTALSSDSPSPLDTSGSSRKQISPSCQSHDKAEIENKSLEFGKMASTTGFPVPSIEGRVATPIAVKRLRSALQGGTSPTSGSSRSQPQSPLDSSSLLKQSFAQSPRVAGQLQDDDQFSDSYLELDSQLALLDGPVDDDEEDNVSESCSFAIPTPGKHLASFTPLPKTPEKEMRNICRSMVKDGIGAMVAVPTSQLQLRGHNVTSLSMAPSVATDTNKSTPAKYSSSGPTSSGDSCEMNNFDNNSQPLRDSSQGTAPREVDDRVKENNQKLESSSKVLAPCIDNTVRNSTKKLLGSSQEHENSMQTSSTWNVDHSASQNRRLEDSNQTTAPGSPNIEDDEDQEYSFVLSYSEFMNLTEINVEDGRIFLEYPLPPDNISERNFSDHQRNLTSMQDHESKSTVDEVDLTKNILTSNDVRSYGCPQDGMKSNVHAKRLQDKESTDDRVLNKKDKMNTGPIHSPPQCKNDFMQHQPVASAAVITTSATSLPSRSITTGAPSSTLPCASNDTQPSSVSVSSFTSSVDAAAILATAADSGCGLVACVTSSPCPVSRTSSQVVLTSAAHLHPFSAPCLVQVNALRARTGSSGGCSTTSSASPGHLLIAESSPKHCNWSPPRNPLHREGTEASGNEPQNIKPDMASMTLSRQVNEIDNGAYSKKEPCAVTLLDPRKGFSTRSHMIIAKPLDFGKSYSKTDATPLNASRKRVGNEHESDSTNLQKGDETQGNLSITEEVLEAENLNSRKSRHRKSTSSNKRYKKKASVSNSGDAVGKKSRSSSSSSSGKKTASEQPITVKAKENVASSGGQTGTNTCTEEATVGSLPESVQHTGLSDARHREPLVEYGSDWKGLRPVPPTPGKFLFTSPPCGETGMRLSASDGTHNTVAMAHLFPPHHLNATPRHNAWPNRFTSTPMSSGHGSSFAAQDAMAGGSAKCTTGSSIENRAGVITEAGWSAGFTVARSEASSDPGYLDRPPKTPAFIDNDALQGSPPKRTPGAALGGFNNNLLHQTGSKSVLPSPEKNLDCSSLSEISAPAESRVVKAPHRVTGTKGAIVLPKKTKEEMAKFIEMFHKKSNKK